MTQTTCGHDNAWYGNDSHVQCFACWTAARNARSAAVRSELARLLAAGLTICEWRGDTFTDWQLDSHSGHALTQRDGRVGFDVSLIHQTAESLASHLESRSRGFGYRLQVYCSCCGESLTDILAGSNDDYTCEDCMGRMDHAAAVTAAELRAEGM